jgi:hypothetical protein
MTPTPKIYASDHLGMVCSHIAYQLQAMGCHVSGASRIDGYGAVIASEARQSMTFCPTDKLIKKVDPRYFRPTEVASLIGEPT